MTIWDMSVILMVTEQRIQSSGRALAEAVKAQSSDPAQWNRLKEILQQNTLQLVSFTITEKGYALQKADGSWFPVCGSRYQKRTGQGDRSDGSSGSDAV